VHALIGFRQPRSETEPGPIVRTHQDYLRSLDQERSQISAAALRNPAERRSSARAVLPGHQPDPRGHVSAAVEGLAPADGRDQRRGDDRPHARDGSQITAMSLALSDFGDLGGDAVDAGLEPHPVVMQIEDDMAHPRRDLVTSFVEQGQQGVADGAQAFADGDALLDQEGPDLVDGGGATRGEARANTRCSACRSSWSWLFSETLFRFGRNAASAIASASL